jgi:uncharacterized protein
LIWIAALASALPFCALLVAIAVGSIATSPARARIGPPPADLPAQTVTMASGSGYALAGWFVPGTPRAGAVLLLHGVRANRLEMLERARFLHRRGLAVLLFDFRASGESAGNAITFGHLEARDARAAFDALRLRAPGEKIGVIGMSMGGASAILAEPPLEADAMVLEAVYASFQDAVEDRLALYFGPLGRLLAPALVWQVKPRLGFDPAELRPVDRIARLSMPILLIAGASDHHAPLTGMKLLFEHASAAKELWIVPGAAHVDFHRYAKADYEARISAFLLGRLKQ